MGYIPIIFFSLAFIFLWAIVNLNTLTRMRKSIQNVRENNLTALSDIQYLAIEIQDMETMPHEKSSWMADLIKTLQKIQTKPGNLQQPSATKSYVELLEKSQIAHNDENGKLSIIREKALSLQNRLRALNKDQMQLKNLEWNYQQMVNRPPSKFIAKIFGFESI